MSTIPTSGPAFYWYTVTSVEEIKNRNHDQRVARMRGNELADRKFDLRQLLNGQDSAALKLLGLLKEEIILFEKPGVSVVICEKGIEVRGKAVHLRTFDLEYSEKDGPELLAIKAALHEFGGKFTRCTPSTFVSTIRASLDAFGKRIQTMIKEDDLGDLIPTAKKEEGSQLPLIAAES